MGKMRKTVNKQKRKRHFPLGVFQKTKTRKKGRETLQVTKHMLHRDQKRVCQAFENHVNKRTQHIIIINVSNYSCK